MKTAKLKINKIKLTKSLFVSIILVILLYVYLVNVLTFSTANRTEMIKMISESKSEITELELTLLEENRKISKDLALGMGLVKNVENDTLIVVRDKSTRLTFNE